LAPTSMTLNNLHAISAVAELFARCK